MSSNPCEKAGCLEYFLQYPGASFCILYQTVQFADTYFGERYAGGGIVFFIAKEKKS